MKQRRPISFVLAAAILLAALWTALHYTRSRNSPMAPTRTAPFNGERPTNSVVGVSNSSASLTHDDVAYPVARAAVKAYSDPEAFFYSENVPIGFWGIVVDQEGKPLSDVQVMLGVRQVTMLGPRQLRSTSVQLKRLTGADGRFEITGSMGTALTVESLEKAGYYCSPSALRSYGYRMSTNRVPDINSPVVLTMWRNDKAEKVIVTRKFYSIVPDGTWYTLDLIQGTKARGNNPGGDLRIRALRPSDVQPGTKYAWGFYLEAVDGGIMAVEDEQTNVAPDSGYLPAHATEIAELQPNWRPEAKQRLFLNSRGGRIYGRAVVEMFIDYMGASAFRIESFINPSGSRNLTYHPSVQDETISYE